MDGLTKGTVPITFNRTGLDDTYRPTQGKYLKDKRLNKVLKMPGFDRLDRPFGKRID